MISKLLAQLIKRKFTAGILLLVVAGGGYWGYSKIFSENGAVHYVIARVQKGTLIISISGSGQVSSTNQVDIKPKASGDVIYIGVKNGQEVKTGALIAQIDNRDAKKAARDAEANLEAAKLSLEKLKKPADALSILQAENFLIQAKESKQKAEDDLKKIYEDGFNTVANAFLDLSTIITGLQDILFLSTLGGGGQWNIDYYADAVKSYDEKVSQYKQDALSAYQAVRVMYDKNFVDYKSASRFSDNSVIESLIDETYDTTKNVAETVKNASNLIQFYKDKLAERNLKINPIADTHFSNLNTYTGKTNTHLLNLLSIKRAIQTNKEAITGAERTIAEKTESLAKIKSGTDALDIQSAELTVRQKENSLLDAKEKLADYFIRASFDGIITKINIKKTDSVSSNIVAATLITKQKLAEISLNEVDVAKIKVGQKSTITFDAVEELSITGKVAEIDSVGVVSQGVVTYTVKIAFDTQDERVKPGMSVSAAIITEVKQNALLIPNSAVKSQNNTQYAEIIEEEDLNSVSAVNGNGIILKNIPHQQTIKTELSNDEFTEVVSGIKEGDYIVTRIIQPDSETTQTQQQSGGLRIPGLPGSGSGR